MIDNFGYIYVFLNLINGKKYVGQTIQKINKRINQHLSNTKMKQNYHLYNSINKYGIENFKVIYHQYSDNKLTEYEDFLVEKLNTIHPFGYNLIKPETPYKHHEDSKKKISNSRIGKYFGEKNPNAQNIEEIKQSILQKHPDCKINNYFYKKGIGLHLNIICENGHDFNLNIVEFKRRSIWCDGCRKENNKGENNSNAKNPEEEKQLILNKHPNCIIGDYFYKNHLLCFNILNCGCGHKFDLQMNSFKSQNSWCRECWNKKRKGENNPSAKSYKITSPNNEIFIIKGTLEKFCKENNLCYGMIKRLLYKNYKNDNYKEWKIEYFNK